LNICFGASSVLWAFILFWGLNGWFQGFGWPGCARLLTHWYSQSERGRWWGMWNTSHNLGGALIPLIAGGCAEYFGWRYALYIPGILCIGFGLILIDRLRDTPQSLGLPAIEIFRHDQSSGDKEEYSKVKERELSTKEVLWEYVLSNPYIWLLGLAYFFIYIIRSAVNDWSALFLVECKNYSRLGATQVVCWFEIGGFFGSLASGWLSDSVFKGRRGPVNLLFTLATMAVAILLWCSPVQATYWDAALFFLLGFFIFGPQMLIGVAAAELSHKKAAATATGFTGTFAYFGAAAAGYPLGKVLQEYGWPEYFYILIGCCVIASLILLPFWSLRTNPHK
jgi:OPA family sugar phosphate sensor protein UhpC-like MFS transporter